MSNSARAIAAVKLGELRRQKELLFAEYERIEAAMRAEPDLSARLRIAYGGLKSLSFAQQPVHPEIGDLQPLVFALDAGGGDEELRGFWLERLERAIASGRRRTAIAFLFGAFLEEGARAPQERELLTAAEEARFVEDLARLDESGAGWREGALAELLEADPAATAAIKDALSGAVEALTKRVTAQEVKHASEALRQRCGPGFALEPELRSMGGELMLVECAGAVSILLDRWSEWSWPSGQTALRPLRNGPRVRPFLDAPLLSALLVQVAGRRCAGLLKTAASRCLRSRRGNGPWDLDRVRRARRISAAFAPRERGYGSDLGPASLGGQLLEFEAELALHRLEPERGLAALQCDIADFYASVSHAVIAELLEALEAPEELRAFIAVFLAPEIEAGRRQRRGLPLGFALSDALAELLLFFLDRRLEGTGARAIRVVDDLLILGEEPTEVEAARAATEAFLSDCGLALQPQKSGAWTAPGPPPEAWPAAPLRWGFLTLAADGVWSIDEEAAAAHEAELRERLSADLPLSIFVREYNAAARSLVQRLAPFAALGEGLELARAQRVLSFRDRLFRDEDGAPRSVLEEARRRFKERFGGELAASECWLLWPITAGGIGLFDPYLELVAYRANPRPRPAPPASRDLPSLIRYFTALATGRKPSGPAKTRAMEALIKDFIDRGGEIRGEEQESLGAYWQWALSLHGPKILEELGSFRFMRTELVPMLMIAGREGTEERGEAEVFGDDIPF